MASASADLAARQHGVVSRKQLLRLGLSDDVIDAWARDGRLHRAHRGIYALNANLDEWGRIHAAVMACGEGTLVSHRSAAYLLGIGERSPIVVDLIPSNRSGRAIDGIRAHLVRYPAPNERAYKNGIPVTSVARTIVDLAGVYGEPELRRSIERAATKRMLDIAAIDAVLSKGPRRRGAPCLRRIIEDWRPVAETTRYATFRSLFEAKLLPLIAAAELPLPRVNALVRTAERTLEVDLLWERERFVVEADSRKHHGIEVAFERDHRRARELIAAGYGCLGVTWREAEQEPEAVFAVIRQELAQRTPPRAAAVP